MREKGPTKDTMKALKPLKKILALQTSKSAFGLRGSLIWPRTLELLLFEFLVPSSSFVFLLSSDWSKTGDVDDNNDHSLCPHRAVLEMPPVGVAEQAKDQLKLICLQAQLGYVLLGLMGEKRLKNYGYPHLSVRSSLSLSLT